MLGMDLIGPLSETKNGNKYIFTATDYFTKWVEAFPLKDKKATSVATCLQEMFYRHGAPNSILSDQGREFINEVCFILYIYLYDHPRCMHGPIF